MKNLAVRLAKCQGYRRDGYGMGCDSYSQWILIQVISRRNNTTDKGRAITTSQEYHWTRLSYAKKRAKELSKELGIPYVEISEWR